MRLAAFNVENLFERARVLNQSQWVDAGPGASRFEPGKAVLDAYSALSAILAQPRYSEADKVRIIELLGKLDLLKSDESQFVILRRNRGVLIRRPRDGEPVVVANGRDDWIGWLELKKEPVDERATENTARVFRDVAADIVVVVEAENRISLLRFNQQVIEAVGGRPYAHVMLIDGNDERGIDVGLMSRAGTIVDFMRSHVDDRGASGPVFSRDCPEYHIKLASGDTLVVLANHFKSKGFGTAAASNARRRAQAARVREIYEQLREQGLHNIAIAGDFNDTPDSEPLAPLLADGADLRDVSTHPDFDFAGRPGTYANGTKGDKIDYLLLSPALFERCKGGGIFRKGVWGGKNGTLWPHFPEIERAEHAASDHAAIFADIDI